MSHETFPEKPTQRRPDTDSGARRVIQSSEEEDFAQVMEWFREAKERRYDFVYHQVRPAEEERRIMIIANGVDSSKILRVLVGEESVPPL